MSRGAMHGAKKVCPDLVGLAGPFTKIARAMSSQWGVRIVPDGSRCETDGKIIRIPFTSDYLPREKRVLLHGMLDHEVCHVAEEVRHEHAGRKAPVELFRDEKCKKTKMMINVFEDIRIERRYSAIYPGMAQNIHAINVESANEWREKHEEKIDRNFWHAFGSAIIMRVGGEECAWTYEGMIGQVMDLIQEELDDAMHGGEWVDWAIDLARRVVEKVGKHAQEQKKQKQGKGKRKPGEGDSEDTDYQPADMEQDPDFEDFAEAAREEMSEYVVHDAVKNNRYIPHPKAVKLDRVQVVAANDVGHYTRVKSEVQAQTQALRAKQRMLIMAWARTKLLTGLDTGFVDDDALTDVRMGQRRVFANTTTKRSLNTAISCIVDCSGSMGSNEFEHSCAYYAYRTAIALAESWAGLGIPNEWLGYTVQDYKHPGITAEDLKGPYFCRPPLDHFVFKTFDEPLKVARGRFAEMRGHGSNVDGESVAWAGRRLAARPEPRKILIVICDGRPNTSDGCVENGMFELADIQAMQNHLRDVIRGLTSAGIEVLCIGAGTDQPKEFYNASTGAKFVHLRDVSTMAMDIFRVMKARITKGAA